MAYFNQVKVVWEPVIERIEKTHNKLEKYEFSIDMLSNNNAPNHLDQIISENKSNSNFPIRTFNFVQSKKLQFVLTRTFFNLIDTITNNYIIFNGKKNMLIEENYDALKLEEKSLIDMIKVKVEDTSENLQDCDSDQDDDEANAVNMSFKTLIRNELGFDVNLDSISGFKVIWKC